MRLRIPTIAIICLGFTWIFALEARAQAGPANEAVRAAQLQLDQARERAESVRRTLMDQAMAQNIQWADARKALDTANAELETARAEALKRVHASDAYLKALEMKAEGRRLRDEVLADASASQEQFTKAAEMIMQATDRIARLEREALENDEAVVTARTKAAQAKAEVARYEAAFEVSLGQDPQYAQAMAEVRTAEQQLASAKQAQAAARQAEAQQARERARQMAEQRRSRMRERNPGPD
jgi:hypothetical protein